MVAASRFWPNFAGANPFAFGYITNAARGAMPQGENMTSIWLPAGGPQEQPLQALIDRFDRGERPVALARSHRVRPCPGELGRARRRGG